MAKFGVWGKDTDYGDSWYTVDGTTGRIEGFKPGNYIYATAVNQVLKEATLIPYAFSKVLNIDPDINEITGNYNDSNSNLYKFVNNTFKTALDSHIQSITVDNATNATNATTASKLGSSTVGSTTQPIYLLNGVATAASTFVVANQTITASTKCKITYDSKGLVTSGADLTASDIPTLDAAKITSGTFADARIASASTWNAKYSKPSGGIPASDLAQKYVRYDTSSQGLTSAQQSNARTNIDAVGSSDLSNLEQDIENMLGDQVTYHYNGGILEINSK